MWTLIVNQNDCQEVKPYALKTKSTYPVTYAFWYRQTTVQHRHIFIYFITFIPERTIYGSRENSDHHCLVNSIFKKAFYLIKTEVLEVRCQIILNLRFTTFYTILIAWYQFTIY